MDGSLLIFAALTGALLAALFAARFVIPASHNGAAELAMHRSEPEIVLLFREGVLVDTDDQIWSLIWAAGVTQPTWDDVHTALRSLVPDLPEDLPVSSQVVPHRVGPYVALAVQPDLVRVTLRPETDVAATWFAARRNEVMATQLQPALSHSPNPIWSVDTSGQVLWGNGAFLKLADAYDSPDALARHVSGLIESPDIPRTNRIALDSEGPRQDRWFEVVTRETANGMLHFATGVDAVVRAEEAQRNFVQTLSKTFANLTTGLAIFDRNRRLALFNPALIDLSGVSAEFLSARPNLFEFFDKLREQQVMPEPKNYDNWRERMARLVAAASDDRFRETWNLAGGQTFDVTGRPYPDGAIAFLFNDITAEVSLTRGFRTELETLQSALDGMEDAVALFNRQGVLTVSNAAYKTMWSVDPDTCLSDVSILDATQEWKSAFHPNPIWPELRDYVTGATERASWDGDLRSKDGREVTCRVDPICYGSTMVRFSYATARRAGAIGSEPLQIVSA